SPLPASRSTTTTCAPSAARRRLVASPMPDAPPVTSADECWSDIAGAAYRMVECAGPSGAARRAERSTMTTMISYPRRLANLAAADPDRPAVTDEHGTVTRAELESLASDTAEEFAALGVGPGDI